MKIVLEIELGLVLVYKIAVLTGDYKNKTNEKVIIIENKKEVKNKNKLSGLTFDFSKRVK